MLESKIVLRQSKQAKQIPKDQLIELSYDSLSNEPLEAIKKIYKKLSIKGIEKLEPKIIDYLNSLGNYKRNKFNNLSTEELQKINEKWDFSFKEWKLRSEAFNLPGLKQPKYRSLDRTTY